MPSSLVRAGKSSATRITSERFLTCVRSDMRGEMVRTGEVSHTDSTLERFLPGVGSHMAGELIRTRETTRAGFDRTAVWSLAWRGLRSLCELLVALHFQNTITSFCGSVVGVVGSRFGGLQDVVV